jgi:hypothetical protein
MNLERLEGLKQISTKNVIVNQVIGGLEKKSYYNKYELEINLSLILFTLFGNTEIHTEMNKEDIDWVSFVNDNNKLIEELRNGEYKDIYEDIFNEILRGAEAKAKYNLSIASMMEDLGELFTEENMAKITEAVQKAKEVSE